MANVSLQKCIFRCKHACIAPKICLSWENAFLGGLHRLRKRARCGVPRSVSERSRGLSAALGGSKVMCSGLVEWFSQGFSFCALQAFSCFSSEPKLVDSRAMNSIFKITVIAATRRNETYPCMRFALWLKTSFGSPKLQTLFRGSVLMRCDHNSKNKKDACLHLTNTR